MSVFSNVIPGIASTMKGMWVTLREYLFRPSITLQYPYKKREVPLRFRGMLVNDMSLCGGCTKCARICPVDCIDVQCEGKGKDRKVTAWILDYQKCCWCQLCVEVCPDASLAMSHDYETVYTDRKKMIRDFVQDPVPPFVEVDPRPGDNPYPKKKEDGKSGSLAA